MVCPTVTSSDLDVDQLFSVDSGLDIDSIELLERSETFHGQESAVISAARQDQMVHAHHSINQCQDSRFMRLFKDSHSAVTSPSPIPPIDKMGEDVKVEQQQQLFHNIPVPISGSRSGGLLVAAKRQQLLQQVSNTNTGPPQVTPRQRCISLPSRLAALQQSTSLAGRPIFKSDGWPDFQVLASTRQRMDTTSEFQQESSQSYLRCATPVSPRRRNTFSHHSPKKPVSLYRIVLNHSRSARPSTGPNNPNSLSSSLNPMSGGSRSTPSSPSKLRSKLTDAYPTPGPSPIPAQTRRT
jgi:hypothetical protein